MTTAERPAPELLTVREVAEILRLHTKHVYVLASEGKLPGLRRIGRAVRFHRATLVAWLASDDQRLSPPRRTR